MVGGAAVVLKEEEEADEEEDEEAEEEADKEADEKEGNAELEDENIGVNGRVK